MKFRSYRTVVNSPICPPTSSRCPHTKTMMTCTPLRLALLLWIIIAFSGRRVLADPPSAAMPKKHASFFQKYCFDCHDAATQEGKVNLESLSFEIGNVETAERWQKVLNVLNAGEMPPSESEQPNAKAKTAFLQDLSQQMVIARSALSDSGGVITMRRLNRREYRNTMKELLGVSVDVADLPPDGGAGAFDTTGASLFFSSDQFEQYLKLAHRALDVALQTGKRPEERRVRTEAEVESTRFVKNRYNRLLDSHERAEQWRQSDKPPTDFGFIDEARVKFEDGNYKRWGPTYQRYLEHPASQTGAVMFNWFQGAHLVPIKFSSKAPRGDYIIRVRVGALDGVPSHRRFLEFGTIEAGAPQGELGLLGCRQVTGTVAEPQIIEIPITLQDSGSRQIGLRERQHNSSNASRQAFQLAQAKSGYGPQPALWIDWVEWQGPIVKDWPSPAHRQILSGVTSHRGSGKGPSEKGGSKVRTEDDNARRIISRFAERAFRGQRPSPTFVDKLVGLYRTRKAAGASFTEAVKQPLAVILASPSFLYMSEPTVESKKRALSDRELAVRLAYFLWSSPPDDELLSLAAKQRLSQPTVLREQTNRLLADRRAWEFVRGFTHQWLDMERLDFFQFNHRLYPEFDDSVKESARAEVHHSFHSILQHNRSLGDLLNSDYVVVNDVLADYYGIPNVRGEHFRKVKLPQGSPRGGLLGMAAILAMGSDGQRSSLVERGAWVLRKLLNAPPPPAPANVPQLSRHSGKLLPARKLLAAHMEEPQCAQCHRRIDPVGYGLENFDAAGRWRDQERTEILRNARVVKKFKLHPIDPSGALPDGTKFSTYQELRLEIAARQPAFARGFTEALIAYALGRPFGFSDQQLADKIIARAESQDYRLRTFMHAIIQSKAFRTK